VNDAPIEGRGPAQQAEEGEVAAAAAATQLIEEDNRAMEPRVRHRGGADHHTGEANVSGEAVVTTDPLPRRTVRTRVPKKPCSCCHITQVKKRDTPTPTTDQEDLASAKSDKRKTAMETKLSNMKEQGTWISVKRPSSICVIDCK